MSYHVGIPAGPSSPVVENPRPSSSRAVHSSVVARRRPSPIELVIALTVLGGVLRFSTLNVQSIWLDESATLMLVHRGFSGMLAHLSASESSPPLYYVLVWIWTKIFGAGPLGFRSFSALVGTLTIPVLYAAGRQISPRVGVWAATLTTVNPAMYYYSQEARCYALLILFSAAAFALWQRALQAPSGRRLAWWAGMSILALLTHYFAAFLFIPEAAVLARRLGWRRVWASAGAVVLVGLALLPLAASQRASGKVHWIEEASLISRVAETAKLFVVGVYGPLEILSALLAGLFVAGAIALLIRRGEPRERAGARDAGIVVVAATALPLLLAATHLVDVYDGRNVIANWVPFAVLVACGLGVARAGRAGTLLGAGLCAISLAVIAAINLIPAYQRDDWRSAAHALGTPAIARVIVSEQYGSAPLSIYLGGIRTTFAPTVTTRELAFVALRKRNTGGAPSAPIVASAAPAGFHLVEVSSSETFAVSRFLAAEAKTVTVRSLRRLSHEPTAEIILQR
jgi:mannosyltransferase